MELENVHPGEILQKDFIDESKLNILDVSKLARIPEKKLIALLEGKERITFNMAHGLAKVFGNSTDFWLNAQKTYDYNERNKEENQ